MTTRPKMQREMAIKRVYPVEGTIHLHGKVSALDEFGKMITYPDGSTLMVDARFNFWEVVRHVADKCQQPSTEIWVTLLGQDEGKSRSFLLSEYEVPGETQ